MTLASICITDVWRALGGGPLRGKRGQAFWRDGDGYSVSLESAKNNWYDHRDGRGGGVLALVEIALGCDRRSALQWLEANCGLDPLQSLTVADRRDYRQEHDDADHFGVAAKVLAEDVLEQLDACDPARAFYARMLGIIRRGGATLTDEYRAWLDTHPELTRAMVLAGASSRGTCSAPSRVLFVGVVRCGVTASRKKRRKSCAARGRGQMQPKTPRRLAWWNSAPKWPEPLAPEAFHGVAGEVVKILEPHSEADPPPY